MSDFDFWSKCFEKCVIVLLEKEVEPLIDTSQFAYKQNRSMLLLALSILCLSILRIRILFVDFSPAFNTVQTHLLL